MTAAPAPPSRRRLPWWLFVPRCWCCCSRWPPARGAVGDAGEERARATRLIANWRGDRASLEEAQRRLQIVMVTRPFDARAWALASWLTRVSAEPVTARGTRRCSSCRTRSRAGRSQFRRGRRGPCRGRLDVRMRRGLRRARAEALRAQALAPDDPGAGELLAALARADHRDAEAIAGLRGVIASPAADSALRASASARLANLYATR